jgi:hypothetical protein
MATYERTQGPFRPETDLCFDGGITQMTGLGPTRRNGNMAGNRCAPNNGMTQYSSLEEHRNAMTAMFNRLDTTNPPDGELTRDEWMRGMNRIQEAEVRAAFDERLSLFSPGGFQRASEFARWNSQRAEAHHALWRAFDAMDNSGDQVVELNEFMGYMNEDGWTVRFQLAAQVELKMETSVHMHSKTSIRRPVDEFAVSGDVRMEVITNVSLSVLGSMRREDEPDLLRRRCVPYACLQANIGRYVNLQLGVSVGVDSRWRVDFIAQAIVLGRRTYDINGHFESSATWNGWTMARHQRITGFNPVVRPVNAQEEGQPGLVDIEMNATATLEVKPYISAGMYISAPGADNLWIVEELEGEASITFKAKMILITNLAFKAMWPPGPQARGLYPVSDAQCGFACSAACRRDHRFQFDMTLRFALEVKVTLGFTATANLGFARVDVSFPEDLNNALGGTNEWLQHTSRYLTPQRTLRVAEIDFLTHDIPLFAYCALSSTSTARAATSMKLNANWTTREKEPAPGPHALALSTKDVSAKGATNDAGTRVRLDAPPPAGGGHKSAQGSLLKGSNQRHSNIGDVADRRDEHHDFAVGLNPHHATGQDPHDPRLHRHRFQYHDPETDQLMYYQYEAKHHEHLVVLDAHAHHVESCSVAPSRSTTTVTLVLEPHGETHTKLLTNGSLLLLHGIECGRGGSPTDKEKLQVRLLSAPTTRARADGKVEMQATVTPAAMHELFEYSHLEFYKGNATTFGKVRQQRHTSLLQKGARDATLFASTETVVGEARKAAEYRTASRKAAREAARKAATLLTKTTGGQRRAKTNSSLMSAPFWGSSSCADATALGDGLRLEGTSCDDDPVQSTADRTCYWPKSNSRSEWALRPGNHYSLRWPTDSISLDPAATLTIEIVEDDTITDDHCMALTPLGGVDVSDGRFDFELPPADAFFAAGNCGSGDASFPEFMLKVTVIDDNDCSASYWPPAQEGSLFRMVKETIPGGTQRELYSYDFSWQYSMVKELYSESNSEVSGSMGNVERMMYSQFDEYGGRCICPDGRTYHVAKAPDTPGGPGKLACVGGTQVEGSDTTEDMESAKHRLVECAVPARSTGTSNVAKVGIEFGCENCVLQATGDIHMLIRTTNFNPFEETWITGDIELNTFVNLFARAFAQFKYDTPTFDLLPSICAPGVCYGGQMAGVEIKLGAYIGLGLSL